MKKRINLILIFTFLGLGSVFAQKFGHVDRQEIMMAMPQRTEAEAKYKAMVEGEQQILQEMQTDYQSKVQEFQTAQQAGTSEALLKIKYDNILSTEKSIQEYQMGVEGRMADEQNKLLEPIVKMVDDAITAYGVENKYTYIFDLSTGSIAYPGGENLNGAIKKKLGILN